MKINGEYWIVNGSVEYADGDIGDKNHEIIATDHVCSQYLQELYDYAKELGVKLPSFYSIEDEPTQSAQSLIRAIEDKLPESIDATLEIQRKCGIDKETILVIYQSNNIDPRLYVMKREGWIAVRKNNIELYGLDNKKLQELASGIDSLLDQEFGWTADEEVKDEELEFNLFDHKTGRSMDLTLADIKRGNLFRPKTLPQTKDSQVLPTVKGKSYGRELWRGTSESISFKKWLLKESQSFDLWLDDERDPKEPYNIENFGSNPSMVWVKTVPEAKELIKSGVVTSISFDNDLGLPEEGKHLARWIEEQAFNGSLSPIKWRVHSMNGEGKREIIAAMKNADRFWSKN